MKKLPQIILASSSKRRTQILSSCHIKHKIITSGVKENMISENPSFIVVYNARKKAMSVAKKIKSGLVIGADTIVFFKNKIIGKPRSKADAKKMLRDFNGKVLKVYTGIYLLDVEKNNYTKGVDVSLVKVRRMKTREIERYFELFETYDRAGSFTIEGIGSIIFDNISGSYFNILGFPMHTLSDLFAKLGYKLIDFVDGKNSQKG